jgi:phage/plasmid-like protein (TIGR03299 family)
MSAEVETMASVVEVPWHGLGRILKDAPKTVEEGLKAGGIDWSVTRVPVTAEFKGHTLNTGHFAVIRETDTKVLGVVGPDYHPVQNSTAFEFFNPFIEQGLCTIETVGSLKGGRRVWMLARVNGTSADIVKGDEVNAYFLVSNSHDGSTRVRLGFTGTRVVCMNTLTIAHGESDLLRVSHTKNAEVALERIQGIVDFQKQKFSATVEKMRELARLGVSADSLRRYVERVFLPEVKKRTVSDEDAQSALNKIHAKVVPLFEKGRGNDLPGVKGTMWAAYNAVSEYMTWEKGRSASTRLDSLWFGEGGKINQRALTEALKIAA